jgi:hypothetical protein
MHSLRLMLTQPLLIGHSRPKHLKVPA